ncbi:hypothetical protein [Nitrospirillum sp. BR 11828]|uniref:hypothetical protein n=1 Tax=Nitrospirillum sp. BR 11828 TaxID=3104325 RepID=UPI002ACA42D6|nr:hypothetical protein [Nitrospirillum sp. BR 11828]MDZ5646437.1 hypothetical protein [Nitrospirillum sp. BR 11828]
MLVDLSCPAAYGDLPYNERAVIVVKKTKGRSPVIYQVAVRAEDSSISADAEKIFDEIAAGFSFLR